MGMKSQSLRTHHRQKTPILMRNSAFSKCTKTEVSTYKSSIDTCGSYSYVSHSSWCPLYLGLFGMSANISCHLILSYLSIPSSFPLKAGSSFVEVSDFCQTHFPATIYVFNLLPNPYWCHPVCQMFAVLSVTHPYPFNCKIPFEWKNGQSVPKSFSLRPIFSKTIAWATFFYHQGETPALRDTVISWGNASCCYGELINLLMLSATKFIWKSHWSQM